MQPSSSRHLLPRAGMVASPHSLEVPKAMGLDLFPRYDSLESLIYLAFDVVENQRMRHELRSGTVVANDILTQLDTVLQTHDMFAIASDELATKVYELIDEHTTEQCQLFQFVVACTQQFYMHIANQAAAEVIEDILSFGMGATMQEGTVFDPQTTEGLPKTDDVKRILAANKWLVVLILYSLRPIHGSELVKAKG